MTDSSLSHKNNITQKKRRRDLTEKREETLKLVCIQYSRYLRSIDWKKVSNGDLEDAVCSLNIYLDFVKDVEKKDAFFNWRSDFAASVIPEFLYRVFRHVLTKKGLPNLFSTRGSVVELSLNSVEGHAWNIRRKNQDLCLGMSRSETIIDGTAQTFVVPAIVFEVKTNIDINKLNGLDFSAERLKRSFPAAHYFLVTETIDFSLNNNYAASFLDEIYVFRKQVRSAARRKKEPLQHDVFEKLLNDVVDLVELGSLAKGHVYERLEVGRLIDG